MAVEFIPIDRETPYIFPPSVQDYLPDDHLARFVVDIVEQPEKRDKHNCPLMEFGLYWIEFEAHACAEGMKR